MLQETLNSKLFVLKKNIILNIKKAFKNTTADCLPLLSSQPASIQHKSQIPFVYFAIVSTSSIMWLSLCCFFSSVEAQKRAQPNQSQTTVSRPSTDHGKKHKLIFRACSQIVGDRRAVFNKNQVFMLRQNASKS